MGTGSILVGAQKGSSVRRPGWLRCCGIERQLQLGWSDATLICFTGVLVDSSVASAARPNGPRTGLFWLRWEKKIPVWVLVCWNLKLQQLITSWAAQRGSDQSHTNPSKRRMWNTWKRHLQCRLCFSWRFISFEVSLWNILHNVLPSSRYS